ncbi:conserved Plasmodium protein, unknown function [Plasmodium ovale curtisi]|uniref:Uncharacterized protein n=1 Tax=Plasmodium ovale curtisi TaxID=864141 RepID=A0A1A8XE01_PLAOA|nr:conserved Plasmodium protein, unknown function [Plasmodium ovale curtisi]
MTSKEKKKGKTMKRKRMTMNHIFTFETNLNDIFAGDDIKKSERSCDYCVKRRRVCKCDTIKRELGSEESKDLEELLELKKYYDEICGKIVDKYKDGVNRFEYDKDIVMYIKNNKINDEIECEDWLYFYELLKERKILERCIDTKQKSDVISLNTFHLDEEANFISCLNYYIKVKNYTHVQHNWMGMSINPFNEYGNRNYVSHSHLDRIYWEEDNEGKSHGSMKNFNSNMGNVSYSNENCDSTNPLGDDKKFHPLYYFSYIQDNERWITGINNSGNILHLENIDYVWNKTVRENSKKIKLFQLITTNCVRNNDMDYDKIKKDIYNENLVRENLEIERILCLSQLVCALGMINIGGCFIMKMKLSFDNFLLSVFAILSICFKKVEVYRPSCCYLRNIVFLIGIQFNGITSIFLSSLNNWVQLAQRELILYWDNKFSNSICKNITEKRKYKCLNHSLIPRKWIKNTFFNEYKNCINHFIDYLIYYLKKCINVLNTNLIKKNIENTKKTYMSQFFEENNIVDIRKKDKLLPKLVDNLYFHDGKVLYTESLKEKFNIENGTTYELGNNKKANDFNLTNVTLRTARMSHNSDTSFISHNSEDYALFNSRHFSKVKNSLLPPNADVKEIFFENTYDVNTHLSDNNIEKYKKQITALLKRIEFNKNGRDKLERRGLFALDEDIVKKRIFSADKNFLLKYEKEFDNMLKKQAYFTNKNWFKSYLQMDVSHFENPLYLSKTVFKAILKCRYYLYYNGCDMHINSLKQIIKQYEPLTTSYINYELHSNVIDCLLVLKNCASLDLFEDSHFLQNFLVISKERIIFDFFSKFEHGSVVSFCDTISTGSGEGEDNGTHVDVENLYEKRTPYKVFSELLIEKLKGKNVCPFVYIDLSTIFPNYVHVVEKELKVKNYFVSSLIIAFNYLKKSGNMIIRLSTALTFFTAGLLYLLFCAFERVDFFLPPTCDDINLDFYIYCFSFNEYYIYRHYVQYIWDALTCNQHIDEKAHCGMVGGESSSVTCGSNRVGRVAGEMQESCTKRRKSEIYFSVPIYFVMNKNFVLFVKKFNSFYFKQHISACLNFMKEPKYFSHDKSLIKCLLTHFFRAYILRGKSFGHVYKSLAFNYDGFDEKKGDDSDDDEEEEDGEGEDDSSSKVGADFGTGLYEETRIGDLRGTGRCDNQNKHEGGEEDNENRDSFKTLFDLKKKEDMRNVKNDFSYSSSESNYSMIYEYENVPSEISISETAWDSS